MSIRARLASRSFFVLLFVASIGLAHASNTITGVVKNCSGDPVRGVTVFVSMVETNQSCNPQSGPCATTDVWGRYEVNNLESSDHDRKACVSAVPITQDYSISCNFCSASLCCNGNRPIATTAGVLIHAGSSSYGQDITLNYSGSCDGSNGAVNTLTSTDCTTSSINLYWQAPSDSGCPVASYDIRYSTSEITEGNWASATQLSNPPTPGVPAAPGRNADQQTYWASVPSSCTWYYFAIKSPLRSGGYSPISNVHKARTKCPPSSLCGMGDD